MQAVTVKQLNLFVKSLIEGDSRLNDIYVTGEISNFKSHYASGHLYFTLKDNDAAIRCVMFRGNAMRVKFVPTDGIKVVLRGRVSIYEKDGQYQFYVDEMHPDGLGDISLAFRQIKERLSKEGLFEQDNKRPLPKFPKRIAVVTSETGAAVQDIINILTRRWPLSEIMLCPVSVQGENAVPEMLDALERIYSLSNCDLIIIGRGGGSIEDLWAFNSEDLARKIFESPLPVISAVGHETDFTICDFVADLRAPTPSAAAELATTPLTERREAFHRLELRLERDVSALLTSCRRRLDLLKSRPVMERPLERIYRTMMDVEETQQRLDKEMTNRLMQRAERWQYLTNRLEAASPLAVMSRGYVMAVTSSGKLLTSVKQAEVGDRVTLHLQDGKMETNIQEKEVFTHGEEESHL